MHTIVFLVLDAGPKVWSGQRGKGCGLEKIYLSRQVNGYSPDVPKAL